MARLILVRHAESEANVNAVVTSLPPGPDLSAYGRKQAVALADRLADQGISAIRGSNTTRARDTARPLAERLGIVPDEYEDLLEISCGDLDGSGAPEAMAEVRRVYDAWFDGHRDEIIPGGETYAEVERRVLRALPGPSELPDGGAMVVVAHGGSLRVAVSGLLGAEVAAGAGYLDNAAYLTLTAAPDGGWLLEQTGAG
jgi:probable phosphoglycerate mutase